MPLPVTVVHVVHSLKLGGSETYAYRIATGLGRTRYRSVVCAMDVGGPISEHLDVAEVPYHIIGRRPGIDWRASLRLSSVFRTESAQVVHTHHFTQLFYSALAARACGARLVHTEHDPDQLVVPRYARAMRLLSRLCFRVYAVSEVVSRVLVDRVGVDPAKVTVMRAGVDLDRYQLDRVEARNQLGLPPDARVALCVARLSPEKNHAGLLRAFRQVQNRVGDAHLCLAGDGPERQTIERMCEELHLSGSVHVLGPRTDVPTLLAACDVAVLASDREGLPLVIMEAMAASRPVVATAVGDVPTAVVDGITGVLAPRSDEAALADAMAAVLGDVGAAASMGRNAREAAEANYDIRRMIAEHEEAYAVSGPESSSTHRADAVTLPTERQPAPTEVRSASYGDDARAGTSCTPGLRSPRTIAKEVAAAAVYRSGYVHTRDRLRRARGTNQAVVLCYHRIGARGPMDKPVNHFRAEMSFLARHYEVVALWDMCARLRSGEALPPRLVAITFDDGYRDNFTNAVPVLTAHGLAATFFVSTGHMGTDTEFSHDVELRRAGRPAARHPNLTWHDLTRMQDLGFEIGSHTVGHVDIGTASPELAAEEIHGSLRMLNDRLGVRDRAFCFPWGKPQNISAAALAHVRAAGYYAAATAYGGTNARGANPLALQRIDVGNGNLSLAVFRLLVAGIVPRPSQQRAAAAKVRMMLAQAASPMPM